jgi:hypothetical protein
LAVKAAMMVYATDLVDEGFDNVLETIQERGAIDGVELAALYHHARDLYPHNPVRRVQFADGGACFFRPDPRRYAGALIQPRRARILDTVDPLALLVERSRKRDMVPRAWTINLHNIALGETYPDCVARNAFGDPLLTDLCPANPDVRAYAVAVSGDIARYGVDAIVAESLTYMPFDHGFHHERCPYPLSPVVRHLLSVCFCEHCQAAFRANGADARRLQMWVRDELQRAIAGDQCLLDDVPLERKSVAALAGGEMGALVDARERVITSLVAEVANAVHGEGPTRLVFMDSMPADDAGDQAGSLLVDRSWRFGVDLKAVAESSDSLSVMGYSRGQDRFLEDLQAYRRVVPNGAASSLVLRAMPPDCYGPGELLPKIRVARDSGLEWVEFYVYGLMRLSGLDWIGQALRADPPATR